ncbi:ABC transporter permease [Vagococcus coleopterorum]|uniref:Cell division protein FtsX n=1 Tax=Vagococcus coleopterorum TaxID=2714946 RepID=A0A6G8ANG9_9ENTE|nr:permease-like cell division protein FtsX [Vagococcus coleopterorum]QIL46546.1 ABC transporter permease [Vagococcus coleopterorum]
MIRGFFRHIGESLKSLKRNGWMTLASVSAVTVTLILVGAFLAAMLNVNKLSKDIENAVDVSVFVNIGTSDKDRDVLETELYKIPGVVSKEKEGIRLSGKDEQLKKLIEDLGPTWKLFDKDNNPLYDVFVVKAETPEQTKDIQRAAAELPNVKKADYGGVSSDNIFKISSFVRKWGLIATIVLLFIAIFLISNTIRITIISRKREIQIMRLVGAKNGFIRWPFFIEGAWIGLLGAIIPVIAMYFGYRKMFNLSKQLFVSSNFSLYPTAELLPKVCLGMLVLGVAIGSLGSIMSMRKFLKV